MDSEERASKLADSEPPPSLSEDEIALIEASNNLRQYDRLRELIRGACESGKPLKLRPSLLVELNRLAMNGLIAAPGAFRTRAIEILGSGHEPPKWEDVPSCIDEMCEYVNDNASKTPLHLCAYVMWRLNWIHPFADGNGRTSRAASYYVLCVGLGYLLPGRITIPEQIAANKRPYYRALEKADAQHANGNLDLSDMEDLLDATLAKQLLSVHESATGKRIPSPVPGGPAWGGGD